MTNNRIDTYRGRHRVVIDRVRPSIDDGRFPVKRVIGETVHVHADIVADGHDTVRALLRYRRDGKRRWSETPLTDQGNDRWTGSFTVDEVGFYEYDVVAWVDHFETWVSGLRKKHDAAVVEETDLLIGAQLVTEASSRAPQADAALLSKPIAGLRDRTKPIDLRVGALLAPKTLARIRKYPDRSLATTFGGTLRVWVDRTRAGFSAWYELFPRSAGRGTKHGTFRDVIERLPYIAQLGFDVVYLPPIHPIGTTKRKGRNNSVVAGPNDPG